MSLCQHQIDYASLVKDQDYQYYHFHNDQLFALRYHHHHQQQKCGLKPTSPAGGSFGKHHHLKSNNLISKIL